MNTPEALALMWGIVKDEKIDNNDKKLLILEFDKVFGLDLGKIKPIKIPKEVKNLVKEREKLRGEKKWREADEIRQEIQKKGWIMEDMDAGYVLRRKL